MFSHNCANAIWNLKGPNDPHLSILVSFLCKKVSITLQRMRASSMRSEAIVVSLAISQLPPLWDTPPVATLLWPSVGVKPNTWKK